MQAHAETRRLKSEEIRLRIEPDLKEESVEVLASLGLDLSDAIRLFLRKVVDEKGLPFAVRQDEIEPRRPSASRIELEKRAMDAVLQGTEWYTAAEIGQRLDAKAANLHAAVNRWQHSGRIFGIDHRGRKIYPSYLFDATWQPLPAVKKILEIMNDYSPFRVASWFESTNSKLKGGRPREVIARDPDVVVVAAKSHMARAVHG